MVAVFGCGAMFAAEPDVASKLRSAETRIRAIYERGEFNPKVYQAEWLPDESAYVRREKLSGGGSGWVRYEADSGKRTVLPESFREGTNENRSPDGRRVVEVRRGNLRVRNLESGETVSLTDVPEDGPVSHGRALWSPDGERVVFVQSDRSRVRLRSMIVPGDPSYPEVDEMPFARVGGDITQLKVGVVKAEGGETHWLPIPSPAEGFYLGQVEWAGNSHEILVEQLSRFRDRRVFLLVDLQTGKMRTIFEESDPAWVVASYRKNSGLEWVNEGQNFVVLSEKDGWRHAYICSRSGREERLITPGDFDIIEKVKVDEKGGWFYFHASPTHGARKYLYRAPLEGVAGIERVTPLDQAGTHDYEFSSDGRWAFHTWSTFDQAPITELVAFPGHGSVRLLEDNAELKTRAKAVITHPTEFFQIDIGDGVVMDGWMLKPKDFDPNRKYPVFVYVYGEPHGQTVLDAWGKVQSHYSRAVADLGYLVVSMDNRGTPAPKGAAWRRAVFGSLGPLSTEEQAKGIQALAATRSYIDLERVGIWGWSGGGSNTLNAMFRRPDVYRVGIAVAPKPQAHLYNAWFQEIYMETRETNPEGYRKASAINYAEGLEGDLLIIHGSGETNTHIEIVEGLVDRLIELGKPFDYMVYPNRNHGIRKGKGTSVHMRMHMIRYLLNHLPSGPR